MSIVSTRLLAGGAAVVIAGSLAFAGANTQSASAADKTDGLGPTTGLLRDNLTLESAIQVDLSKETVRLPLYKGRAGGQTVWFVLLDSSDQGLAHNHGINYAPKLANLPIGCPECVQDVTLEAPTPAENPFGQAVVDFAGKPDFSPTRVAEPGQRFPAEQLRPRRGRRSRLQPVHPDQGVERRLQCADRRHR